MTWTDKSYGQHLPQLRATVLFLFSTIGLYSPCGYGQSKAVLCDDLAPCREAFAKAQRLAKEGQQDRAALQAALQGFLDLFSRYPDPRLCFPIGRLLQRQGQLPQAVQYYRQFLNSGVETDPQQLATTRRRIEETEAEITRSANAQSADPSASLSRAEPSETKTPREAPTQTRLPVVGMIFGSSAVLLAITSGIVLGVGAANFNSLQQTCSPYCSDDQVQPVQRTFQASYALFGLAGIAAVTAAVVLPLEVIRLRKKKNSTPPIALRIGVGSLTIGERL